jgi:hypothetical protein
MHAMILMTPRDAGTVTTGGAQDARRDGADARDASLFPFEAGVGGSGSRQPGPQPALCQCTTRAVSTVTAVTPYMPRCSSRQVSLVLKGPRGCEGLLAPGPTIASYALEGPISGKGHLPVLELAGCNPENREAVLPAGVTHCSLNNESIRVGRASIGPLIMPVAAPVAAKAFYGRASNCAAPARRDFLHRKSSVFGAL